MNKKNIWTFLTFGQKFFFNLNNSDVFLCEALKKAFELHIFHDCGLVFRSPNNSLYGSCDNKCDYKYILGHLILSDLNLSVLTKNKITSY